MSVQLLQKPQATSSLPSVTAASVTHTKEETTTQIVHAGFTLGSRLPAVRNPGYREGAVLGFVAYMVTTQVTYRTTTNYLFSVSQRRPQTKDPVQELRDHSQRNPASATLFWRETTTAYTTTITVLYFGCVLGQAPERHVPPPPKPLPAQMPKQLAAGNEPADPAEPSFKPAQQVASEPPAATVSLNPVGPSKTSEPSAWPELPFDERGYRYDVWNASNQERPPEINVFSKSLEESMVVTPRGVNPDGLSFTGVDAFGDVYTIPFSDVDELSVR